MVCLDQSVHPEPEKCPELAENGRKKYVIGQAVALSINSLSNPLLYEWLLRPSDFTGLLSKTAGVYLAEQGSLLMGHSLALEEE